VTYKRKEGRVRIEGRGRREREKELERRRCETNGVGGDDGYHVTPF